MKIPLNWLRDYVDIALEPAQLAERLTFAGLEVAGVRVVGLPIPEGLASRPSGMGWPDDAYAGHFQAGKGQRSASWAGSRATST